jgi:hypothetical protein
MYTHILNNHRQGMYFLGINLFNQSYLFKARPREGILSFSPNVTVRSRDVPIRLSLLTTNRFVDSCEVYPILYSQRIPDYTVSGAEMTQYRHITLDWLATPIGDDKLQLDSVRFYDVDKKFPDSV